ncbi:MAG: ATPase domain-containing protein [Tranquillimonas sp.]
MEYTILRTGDAGLDEVLRGGLPEGNMYLMQGPPGSGKTTFALQFLRQGLANGERALYVSLSQTEDELRRIAASHGWTLDGIEIVELVSETPASTDTQAIFLTSDLRLDRTRELVEKAVLDHEPHRLVYDSLLEVRLLTGDEQRFQRELIGLRSFLYERGITTLLLDVEPTGQPLNDIQSRGIVHGILTLDKHLPEFGRARRRLEVAKMRGVAVYDGWHDVDIRPGEGLKVFPRIVPEYRADDDGDMGETLIRSGLQGLDEIFGGGMEPGTTTMVVGQAGTGKSTMASLYAAAALERGEDVALFLFEERVETFFRRSEGLGMDLRQYHAEGRLRLHDFNPDEISAGEFGKMVQKEANSDRLRVVVIDSFTGYMSSLANHRQALFDIQSLLKYLSRRNVLTILVVAEQGLLGNRSGVALDLSFLGDTVLLLRMLEREGRIRREIVAVKKRHGPHLLDVRELVIESGQVSIREGE